MRKLLLVILLAVTTTFAQNTPRIEPGVSHTLAQWRAARYSDIRYKLNLTLEKMSPVLKGSIEIRVRVHPPDVSEPGAVATGFPIILDWRKLPGHEKDSTLSKVTLNGIPLIRHNGEPDTIDGQSMYIEDREHLIFSEGVKLGENVITLDFTSPILTSGSAITRYIDKEDGSEYIYSLFVPSDASTAFPVFDQPDLKARFTLSTNSDSRWTVISNGGRICETANETYGGAAQLFRERETDALIKKGLSGKQLSDAKRCLEEFPETRWQKHISFAETRPISTYVFAFAAGPFDRVSVPPAVAGGVLRTDTQTTSRNAPNLDTSPNAPPATAGGTDALTTSVYVRKSQAAKFPPHSAEVFRLVREDVKYLETYFDYKFPFPKYDIVLIPEFPFGGMEHAGATFLRESAVIFPTEPTKSDEISRATLIFHETAHQWFGDTVTMKWFDDLWLKEGFANFMAYKALEKIMPEANAWKVFYERIKQPAYATDSTKGTTAIYQPIENLSAAKSAYGNIVYNKAPAFLRQAEFYLGEKNFQTAVRAFLKKHEYGNAGWEDLVREFETSSNQKLGEWADFWVNRPGLGKIRIIQIDPKTPPRRIPGYITLSPDWTSEFQTEGFPQNAQMPLMKGMKYALGSYRAERLQVGWSFPESLPKDFKLAEYEHYFTFPNYQDYAYGIFLLDDKSRDYVLKNVQNENDAFLRSMMYGALWDSVRESELDPKVYVDVVIRNLPTETNETIVQSMLGRTTTAMNYYIAESGGRRSVPPATARGTNRAGDLRTRLENVLLDRINHAPTPGLRITFYRAFLNIASTERARGALKQFLAQGDALKLRPKDRFDIVNRLATLGDPDAPKLLTALDKTETGDDAKRYAYAAHAAFATKENREKYWRDFVSNKDISESWIEAAASPFNSISHSDLSLPFLERALAELPNLKRTRKIFFINNWLGAFIGGQRDQAALDIVNKFLTDNPNLDNDLRLKILENADLIERAVKIRSKFAAK